MNSLSKTESTEQTKVQELVRALESSCSGLSIKSQPRSVALADETPTRIKKAAIAIESGEVLVLSPATIDQAASCMTGLSTAKIPFTLVGLRSNVINSFEGAPSTVVSTENLVGEPRLDAVSQTVTVLAGMNGGDLENWLNERNLTLGQYPQSLYISTVGGWMNTRATGSSSAKFGGFERAVKGAKLITVNGKILEFAPRARPMGGLDAIATLVGTEGSLGLVAEITIEVHRQHAQKLVCFTFPDLASNIAAQREMIHGAYPVAVLRGYNLAESKHILGSETDGCLLLIGSLAPEELLDANAKAIAARLAALGGTELPGDAAERWFNERYEVETMMTSRNGEPGKAFDTIEVSVPWSQAIECATAMEETISGISQPFFLHFSHAYTNGVCFYSILWLEDKNDVAVVEKLRNAWNTVLDIVAEHGGMTAHHHGIGGVRAARYIDTAEAEVHRALKGALDPDGLIYSRMLAG